MNNVTDEINKIQAMKIDQVSNQVSHKVWIQIQVQVIAQLVFINFRKLGNYES